MRGSSLALGWTLGAAPGTTAQEAAAPTIREIGATMVGVFGEGLGAGPADVVFHGTAPVEAWPPEAQTVASSFPGPSPLVFFQTTPRADGSLLHAITFNAKEPSQHEVGGHLERTHHSFPRGTSFEDG